MLFYGKKDFICLGIIILVLLGYFCTKMDNVKKDPDFTVESKVHVQLIIDQDNCKVYRFEDMGEYHYFKTCED